MDMDMDLTWTWTWTSTSTSTCICVPYLDRDDEYDVEDVVSIVKTKVCLIILRSKCSSNLSRNDDVDAWADRVQDTHRHGETHPGGCCVSCNTRQRETSIDLNF